MKLYALALTVFLAIDMLWLGLIARQFYTQQIGFLMKTGVNWAAAFLFYFLFIAGLIVFVILPTYQEPTLTKTIMLGALFGLVTYATYDLTNLATVKNWPVLVTVVDLIWGTTLSTLVSVITVILAKKLGL